LGVVDVVGRSNMLIAAAYIVVELLAHKIFPVSRPVYCLTHIFL